jgi:hypothetical protein
MMMVLTGTTMMDDDAHDQHQQNQHQHYQQYE